MASWTSQAELFRRAYEYSNGKIDFFAANAGTAEREHLTLGNPLEPEDVDGEPKEPNFLCTQVNQIAVFCGVKLYVHYTRRTAKRLKSESSTAATEFTPKMVITSSCSALYPFPIVPEYGKSYIVLSHPSPAADMSQAPPSTPLWLLRALLAHCCMQRTGSV